MTPSIAAGIVAASVLIALGTIDTLVHAGIVCLEGEDE